MTEVWKFYYIFVQFLVFEIKGSKGTKDVTFKSFQPRAGFPRGGGGVRTCEATWTLNLEPWTWAFWSTVKCCYRRQSQILTKLLNPLTSDVLQITMLICNLLSKCCYTKHISNLTVMEIKAHFYIVIFIKWLRLINTPCRPKADTFVSPVLSIIAQQYLFGHNHCIAWADMLALVIRWEPMPSLPAQDQMYHDSLCVDSA